MKIITRTIENTDNFSAALSDVLYLDVETTGLSAERANIYLIGCAGHEEGGWHMTQWLDQTGNEEKEIISSFLAYAAGFKTLIHFNGAHFDLPFLMKRSAALGLDAENPVIPDATGRERYPKPSPGPLDFAHAATRFYLR